MMLALREMRRVPAFLVVMSMSPLAWADEPISESEPYLPGRSITQRPLKRASSHTSQVPPSTTADAARSLNPKRSRFPMGWSVLNERPRKPSRS